MQHFCVFQRLGPLICSESIKLVNVIVCVICILICRPIFFDLLVIIVVTVCIIVKFVTRVISLFRLSVIVWNLIRLEGRVEGFEKTLASKLDGMIEALQGGCQPVSTRKDVCLPLAPQ